MHQKARRFEWWHDDTGMRARSGVPLSSPRGIPYHPEALRRRAAEVWRQSLRNRLVTARRASKGGLRPPRGFGGRGAPPCVEGCREAGRFLVGGVECAAVDGAGGAGGNGARCAGDSKECGPVEVAAGGVAVRTGQGRGMVGWQEERGSTRQKKTGRRE